MKENWKHVLETRESWDVEKKTCRLPEAGEKSSFEPDRQILND
jgi:hypothetical protein